MRCSLAGHGPRRAARPVPRPRARRLPQRGHLRAAPAAAARAIGAALGEAVARGSRPGLLRARCSTRARACARPTRAARRRRRRRRADDLDQRRHRARARRTRPARRRRGAHLRRGAPRPARAAGRRARAARRSPCARCRSRSIAEAVGPQTRLVACSHVSWVNGELVPGPRRPSTSRCCSTARRASARSPIDVARARLRLLRGLRPEVAVRPGRHGDAVGLARVARAAAGEPARRTSTSTTRAPARRRRRSRARAATTRRR